MAVNFSYDISIAQLIEECKTEVEKEAMRKLWDEFLNDFEEYDLDDLCSEQNQSIVASRKPK